VSTGIEWTDVTWNPTTGCDRISPGCDNCYALTLAKRLKGMGQAKYQADGDPRSSGPGFGVAVHTSALAIPLGWRKPRRVFVNSMSDLFHARVPRWFVAEVFAVMARTPQHTYQILTKRPGRMRRIVGDEVTGPSELIEEARTEKTAQTLYDALWPLGNVWLGTSIEDDEHAGRADAMRDVAAAVRFLSLEPLLGPLPSLDLAGFSWAIAGGESGPNARPLDLGWVREIRDRCVETNVAFFFKQVGGRTPKSGGRHLDGRTWDQMPRPAHLARAVSPRTAAS
jgi:protein gp37